MIHTNKILQSVAMAFNEIETSPSAKKSIVDDMDSYLEVRYWNEMVRDCEKGTLFSKLKKSFFIWDDVVEEDNSYDAIFWNMEMNSLKKFFERINDANATNLSKVFIIRG